MVKDFKYEYIIDNEGYIETYLLRPCKYIFMLKNIKKARIWKKEIVQKIRRKINLAGRKPRFISHRRIKKYKNYKTPKKSKKGSLSRKMSIEKPKICHQISNLKSKSLSNSPRKPISFDFSVVDLIETIRKKQEKIKRMKIEDINSLLALNNTSINGIKITKAKRIAAFMILGVPERCKSCFSGELFFDLKIGKYMCKGSFDSHHKYKFCSKVFSLNEIKTTQFSSGYLNELIN